MHKIRKPEIYATVLGMLIVIFALPAFTGRAAATETTAHRNGPMLLLPMMDAQRGKLLFVSKGCVMCHSINGVGGTDAPKLDASTMPGPMNPLDFAAKMWNHSAGMVAMQIAELGGQVHFSGDELGDIIAFSHDEAVQRTFSKQDLPPSVRKKLEAGD